MTLQKLCDKLFDAILLLNLFEIEKRKLYSSEKTLIQLKKLLIILTNGLMFTVQVVTFCLCATGKTYFFHISF